MSGNGNAIYISHDPHEKIVPEKIVLWSLSLAIAEQFNHIQRHKKTKNMTTSILEKCFSKKSGLCEQWVLSNKEVSICKIV